LQNLKFQGEELTLTVQQELASLEKLQQLDLKNFEIRKELEDIPQEIEETRKNVEHVRIILEKEKARLNEAESWYAQREKEIALQNDMLVKSKSKLSAAQNERETKAAQREIDTIRKHIQDSEKEMLELMEAIDQYRIAINEHTGEFAKLEEHLAETEAAGKKRLDDAEAQIAKTKEERQRLAEKVPTRILRQYERIHKRLGRALVEVVDGNCTGCNISLLPQLYNELQRGEKIFSCPSCSRILIYKEKTDTEDSIV
jgi:predicted  nucleic acid-binding Zn-ribbon protein